MPRSSAEPRRREATIGGVLLLVIVLGATAGAAFWPQPPNRTLEPAIAALAPPGARFEVLELRDGRRLAARTIERADGRFRLHRPDGVLEIASERAAAPPTAVRLWLGSDRFGRDLAARLLHGARVSLAVAIAAVALALTVGVPLGLTAGLARGRAAGLLLAVIEGAQAFPRLFLVVALAAVITPGTASTAAILGLTGWMPVARLVRAEARRLAATEFVLAARGTGASPLRVAWRHVLPGSLAPVGVEATLGMAGAVAGEAALAFLGLGAPPPAASWGNLIADGRDLLSRAAWISIAPGIALVITVLACHLVAEGARDRLDPRRATLST